MRFSTYTLKKKTAGIYIEIVLDLKFSLGTNDILTILSLPIHEHVSLSIYLGGFLFHLARLCSSLCTSLAHILLKLLLIISHLMLL